MLVGAPSHIAPLPPAATFYPPAASQRVDGLVVANSPTAAAVPTSSNGS